MEVLGDWRDAPAVILSCPGPLRRHSAAILPVSGLRLPQVLLGSESQLLAFAAHAGPDARLAFAPLPEMFDGAEAWAAALPGIDPARAVHLRFGGVRAARLLKGARNACVLAERTGPPPLTASHHPFAPGTVLPASVQRVYALCGGAVRPTTINGNVLPVHALPAGLEQRGLPEAGDGARKGLNGLELACLADFRSDAWAAGRISPVPPPPGGSGCVLVPWNMDHPGSIVPELLARLVRVGGPAVPRVILLPFNYIGQTGIIRAAIGRLREEGDRPGAALADMFIARVCALSGVAALKRLARTAWVDGNDPEHWWTIGRLRACGIATLLLDAGGDGQDLAPTDRIACDERVWVEAETRCGELIFPARLPSLRALPALLARTASIAEAPARRRRRAGAAA